MMPSRRTSSATADTRSSSVCIAAGTSSQPSRLAMASPASDQPASAPQAETSRRQMRPNNVLGQQRVDGAPGWFVAEGLGHAQCIIKRL